LKKIRIGKKLAHVEAPAERRHGGADDGVLIDRDDLGVLEDLQRRVRGAGELYCSSGMIHS
jgi:hypothetical protein